MSVSSERPRDRLSTDPFARLHACFTACSVRPCVLSLDQIVVRRVIRVDKDAEQERGWRRNEKKNKQHELKQF